MPPKTTIALLGFVKPICRKGFYLVKKYSMSGGAMNISVELMPWDNFKALLPLPMNLVMTTETNDPKRRPKNRKNR